MKTTFLHLSSLSLPLLLFELLPSPLTAEDATIKPWDCQEIEDNLPEHGQLSCYDTAEGTRECTVICEHGYVTRGPSTVQCKEGLASSPLVCEPAYLMIAGGKSDQSPRHVELYSLSNPSCRVSLPALPTLYQDASLDYVDGCILLCGGAFSGTECLTLTSTEFNGTITSITWEHHSTLTTRRAHHATGIVRNILYLLGGEDHTTEFFRTPFGPNWEQDYQLSDEMSKDGCAAPISPTEVVISGGHDCEKCTFILDLVTGETTRVGDMKDQRSSHGCTSYMDPEGGGVRVLVAGGWHGKDVATAEVFNPTTLRWRVVGDLKAPRRGLKLAIIEGGKVVAVGGHHTTDTAEVDIYDTLLETWEPGPPMMKRRWRHAMTPVPSSMFECM